MNNAILFCIFPRDCQKTRVIHIMGYGFFDGEKDAFYRSWRFVDERAYQVGKDDGRRSFGQ